MTLVLLLSHPCPRQGLCSQNSELLYNKDVGGKLGPSPPRLARALGGVFWAFQKAPENSCSPTLTSQLSLGPTEKTDKCGTRAALSKWNRGREDQGPQAGSPRSGAQAESWRGDLGGSECTSRQQEPDRVSQPQGGSLGTGVGGGLIPVAGGRWSRKEPATSGPPPCRLADGPSAAWLAHGPNLPATPRGTPGRASAPPSLIQHGRLLRTGSQSASASGTWPALMTLDPRRPRFPQSLGAGQVGTRDDFLEEVAAGTALNLGSLYRV